MLRFAANLALLFNEVALVDRFDAAARAGFDAVELAAPYEHAPEELARAARDAGVSVALLDLPPGNRARGDRGVACDPDRAVEFRDGLARALAYAGVLGCTRLNALAGVRPPGAAEEDARAAWVAAMRLAARAAATEGRTVLFEAIAPREVPGYLVAGSRLAFELLAEVGEANVRYLYDVYQMQIAEGDLARTLERGLAGVGHVRIADVPGRHEPGTGEVNFQFLLRHLERIGYRGLVGCAYRPRAGTVPGLAWMAPFRGG
jgi:hydroxypyruvate isomerase